jgi:hypothetical protein
MMDEWIVATVAQEELINQQVTNHLKEVIMQEAINVDPDLTQVRSL